MPLDFLRLKCQSQVHAGTKGHPDQARSCPQGSVFSSACRKWISSLALF